MGLPRTRGRQPRPIARVRAELSRDVFRIVPENVPGAAGKNPEISNFSAGIPYFGGRTRTLFIFTKYYLNYYRGYIRLQKTSASHRNGNSCDDDVSPGKLLRQLSGKACAVRKASFCLLRLMVHRILPLGLKFCDAEKRMHGGHRMTSSGLSCLTRRRAHSLSSSFRQSQVLLVAR